MKDKIQTSAERLTLLFSEDKDIPSRFKNRKIENLNINRNSPIEIRFQELTKEWILFIEIMLSKIDPEQAWRYIRLSPLVEKNLSTVTLCKDFCDFTSYFILRRDIENCNHIELGQLAMLHTAFQKRIEQQVEEIKK